MSLKNKVKKILPNLVWSKIKQVRNSERVETLKLNAVNNIELDASNLLSGTRLKKEDIFSNKAIWKAWKSYEQKIKALKIPDLTGGVNLGDRKAIFFIMCYFKPKSILEIGTHIGASTVNIACALNYNYKNHGMHSEFSTLDIRDVNCTSEKPWLKFDSPQSPQELINALNLEIKVKFMNQDSLAYLKNSSDTYDLIFLDGDHSAQTVYKEVPKALERLNEGGVILLHDYFKKGDSANPKNDFNSGPYLGIQRHIKEGANITVKPFGALPWETKLGSKRTSLALLLRNG